LVAAVRAHAKIHEFAAGLIAGLENGAADDKLILDCDECLVAQILVQIRPYSGPDGVLSGKFRFASEPATEVVVELLSWLEITNFQVN
jgi:hypothetical protein